VPPGRHRKPSVAKAHGAGVAALATLALATAVPAAAALRSGAPGGGEARAEPQPRQPVVRTTSRAASRSADRRAAAELLAARLAASTRPGPVATAVPEPAELRPRWVTADLNVWARPGEDGRLLTVLDTGAKVLVTGETAGAWAQVRRGERLAWVRKAYLDRDKPAEPDEPAQPPAPAGVSYAPCPDGSAVESGLMPNTVKVYRAVCAAFPAITTWGGRSGGGNHGAGLALDIMVSGEAGWAVAEYVRARAGELGASEVIFSQRIWTVQRSGEGWRAMEDRGSITANHYDHVHVTVY